MTCAILYNNIICTRPVTFLCGTCYIVLNYYYRCCCGRAENQHGKLTTVQEENEELEIANDAAEESDSYLNNSEPEDEVFNTEESVQFAESQGCFKI